MVDNGGAPMQSRAVDRRTGGVCSRGLLCLVGLLIVVGLVFALALLAPSWEGLAHAQEPTTTTTNPTAGPTETLVPTETTTETPTEVPTETTTEAPTEVPTETPAPTSTEAATPTATMGPTETLVLTETATATSPPTDTPTPPPTDTPLPTETATLTPSPQPTDTATPLSTETPLPTEIATATATPVAPTPSLDTVPKGWLPEYRPHRQPGASLSGLEGAATVSSRSPLSSSGLLSMIAPWPMYLHDQHHSGYNPLETNLQPPFSLAWSFDPDGQNNHIIGSPTVVGNRVYVGAYVDGEGVVYALAADTGEIIWQTPIMIHLPILLPL